jgi:hypothetical protein
LVDLFNVARLEVNARMKNGKPLSSIFAVEDSGGE